MKYPKRAQTPANASKAGRAGRRKSRWNTRPHVLTKANESRLAAWQEGDSR